MIAEATRTGGWLAGLTEGCERLVHPTVNGESRARQRRLLMALLAGPFVAAAAIMQAAMPACGAGGALALLCAAFAASWLAALYVATRGVAVHAERGALVISSLLAGALVVLSGGVGAPAALLLAIVPLETMRISGSRHGAMIAAALGVGAVGLFSLARLGGGAVPVDAAWQWISPAIYGGLVAVHKFAANKGTPRDSYASTSGLPEDRLGSMVVRFARSGEVESISPQARQMLRVEPELLLAAGLFDRVHVGDRVALLCALAEVREDGRPRRCEARVRMPVTAEGAPGGYRPFEFEILRPGESGETVCAIVRDVSDVAGLREELERALERAGESEVAKGRFLAAVSHELRTPLNAIIGFSDMLLHREISGGLSSKQTEHVTLIKEAGNHLLSVVNAILDVSKIEAGAYSLSVEPFDLKPAVALCCAMLEPQAAAKGVKLSAQLPQGLGEVVGDQRAVQQILLNLLSNAIKFTPEGGSVSVSASRRGDTLRMFVNDTGIGISSEDLESLGTPFVQVQNDYTRQFQGTGLGLSLVKGLVKLHGGSMSIESAPALGTTVTIGLPAVDRAAVDAEEGETEKNHGTTLHKIA